VPLSREQRQKRATQYPGSTCREDSHSTI
jgi:hypothetical protein